ncbi:MAG: RNA polymerase sigma factor RpoH [Rhodospirillales bacterium]|jgi:RNA polymerase sigma-32 factor|nr:RNA polymerase sigma factor RpoH [Rhodospirillales bacterium]
MTARKLSVPAVSEDGLQQYYRRIWSYPMLQPEEEYMLAMRWHEHQDVDAAHRLVTSHLRLVAKIAGGYRGYGLPLADLVSEGNIGLMKAVKKFEPQRGFRLATYAMWWIRAAITEYILRSWSLVKMGTVTGQKKLFFSLGRIKRTLNVLDSGDLSAEDVTRVAEALDVPERDVVNMNRRLGARDVSLNAPRRGEEQDGAELMETLVDEAPSPEAVTANRQEAAYRRGLLRQALAELPERERHIVAQRQLSEQPKTLEELGVHFGVSRERVRQLEARAMDKLRKAVHRLGAAGEMAAA